MSREEDILSAIINDESYDKTPQSRNEEILLSIINDTEYNKTPQSRIEELYLQLKEKIGPGPGPTPPGPTPTPTTKNGVIFYDYDGTVVASYTKAQFLALTEMPANPTHERLVAQGWNWTLEDAKTYVEKYGSLNIGQMYNTASGALEIDIELHDGRLHPYLGLNINGSVTVDWGDGTETDTMTGTAYSPMAIQDHTYASEGSYTIKVSATEGTSVEIVGTKNYSYILTDSYSPSPSSPTKVYNSAIKFVHLSNFVSIGKYAFTYCYSLSFVTMPNSVTTIGAYAFAYCYSLSSVTMPNSVTRIDEYAFSFCYSLASVTIPNSLTSTGTDVFAVCFSLLSITIPSGQTSIVNRVFSSCYSLLTVIIPNSVTSIITSAFNGCYSLPSVTIPSSVTSIGNGVFQSCFSLSSVTIPSSVTSIESYAFQSCYSLGYIKFESQTPPTTIGSNVWSNIPTDCIIYVPTGTIDAYKATTNMPNPSSYTYVEYDPAA